MNAPDAHCPTTLEHSGASYVVYRVTDEIVGAEELGVGTEQGCGDKGPWTKEVAVSSIAGVEPGIALVTPVAAHVLYVADGVAVNELPSDIAELIAP